MARFISSRLLIVALGALVLGGSFFATTGTASADGPKQQGGYHDWDKGDWHDNDKDKDKHKDRYSYNCSGWWEGEYWNAHWDTKWDKNRYDRDCKDNDRYRKVTIIYVYPSFYPSQGYVYFPYTAPEFGRYSDGLAGLIQDASMVVGITEQAMYDQLARGRTLIDIGIQHGIGQLALMEGLVALNPDLAPYVGSVVGQPFLLVANLYIPM